MSQSLASIVTRLDRTHKSRVYVHVFNADAAPELHEEAHDVSDLFNVTVAMGTLPELSGAAANLTEVTKRKLQEGLGFVHILREMQSWSCQSYVLLEDDALAQHSWYAAGLLQCEVVTICAGRSTCCLLASS